MAAPPVCPASCGLRLGAAVPFRPRCDALPPPPAWRRPPAPPSPAGSWPAVSGGAPLFVLGAAPIPPRVAALVFAERLVLFAIRRLGGRQHASDLGFQFRLA